MDDELQFNFEALPYVVRKQIVESMDPPTVRQFAKLSSEYREFCYASSPYFSKHLEVVLSSANNGLCKLIAVRFDHNKVVQGSGERAMNFLFKLLDGHRTDSLLIKFVDEPQLKPRRPTARRGYLQLQTVSSFDDELLYVINKAFPFYIHQLTVVNAALNGFSLCQLLALQPYISRFRRVHLIDCQLRCDSDGILNFGNLQSFTLDNTKVDNVNELSRQVDNLRRLNGSVHFSF